QVTNTKFEAVCLESGYETPLRDLVVGIFAVLEHTPFEQMGLNYFVHEAIDQLEWSRIQQHVFKRLPFETVLSTTSLQSLAVEGNHDEAPGARLQIKIEPSVQIVPGVFTATNEHYQESGPDAGRRLMEILNRRWDGARSYARSVSSHLLSLRHEGP